VRKLPGVGPAPAATSANSPALNQKPDLAVSRNLGHVDALSGVTIKRAADDAPRCHMDVPVRGLGSHRRGRRFVDRRFAPVAGAGKSLIFDQVMEP
jgi:hypothetical protein